MKRIALFLFSAVLIVSFFMLPALAEGEREEIAVNSADGTVTADDNFDGPQIVKVRVLYEARFLEIYWDRYVDEEAAVDPANFTLTAGGKTVTLTPNTLSSYGWTDTIFFDRQNKVVASSDAHCMNRLDPDLHMSSISFPESELSKIEAAGSDGFTLEVRGGNITDKSGNTAKDAVYTGVPRLNFYTQKVPTESGITIKGDDTVALSSLELAARQVEVELSKPGTGIAETMKEWGCSLAVYSPHENVYMIPEHRYGFRTSMYDLEGYGGSKWNNCTSSIAEANIIRTRGNTADPYLNTMYPNENVLIHEFGHCIKSIGLEENPDQTLIDEYFAAYENAVDTGLWPNTYAISNSDEFFATMCAIWFNNMDDVSSWSDGTRSPLNTREEMKNYDPLTYAFFEKILPSDAKLPSPWDVASPDNYHGEYIQPPKNTRFACEEDGMTSDVFKLETRSRGTTWQVDRYAPDVSQPDRDLCLWTPYVTDGDASSMINGPWRVEKLDDGTLMLSSPDQTSTLTAANNKAVRVQMLMLNKNNDAMKWRFVEEPETSNPFDGYLINVKTGKALAFESPARDGTLLTLVDREDGALWMLRNTSETKGERGAFLTPTSASAGEGQGSDTETTPAPTETTAEPSPASTDTAKTGTAAVTDGEKEEKRSGCSSSLSASAAVMLTVISAVCACAYVRREKRE